MSTAWYSDVVDGASLSAKLDPSDLPRPEILLWIKVGCLSICDATVKECKWFVRFLVGIFIGKPTNRAHLGVVG